MCEISDMGVRLPSAAKQARSITFKDMSTMTNTDDTYNTAFTTIGVTKTHTALPVVYLVGEHLTVLKHVMSYYGITVGRTSPMHNFGRRTVSPDATAMLQALQREKPDLIWIQWNEHSQQPARRPNVRTAVEFLSGLVEIQIQTGRMAILEGKASDIPVRDEVFEGSKRLVP